MTITWIHYIIAGLAILLHILTKLQSKHKDGLKIQFSIFFYNNWINVAISAISTVVLFMTLNDLVALVDIPMWGGRIVAFMVGWFNYSFIRHLTGMFKKQTGMG